MEMQPLNKQKIDVNGLIEQYRWWIGTLLLLAIIASAGYLFWKTNLGQKAEDNFGDLERLTSLEEKIADQGKQIGELKTKLEGVSAAQVPSAEAETSTAGVVAGASSSKPSATVTGKVNLNSASLTELDTLPGIGPAYATRIIEYRQSHGGFRDISELKNIKGIGAKTYEKLKEFVTI